MQHAIKVKLNAKYKTDENGEHVLTKNAETGKEEKVVEVPAREVSVTLEAPAISELDSSQIEKLYQSVLEEFVAPSAREADKNGRSEVSVSATFNQLLGERVTFSDELIEAFTGDFTNHLKAAGKNEAQIKLCVTMSTMRATSLSLINPVYVAGFQRNLQAFAESLEAGKLAEYEPVITRAASRAEEAAKQSLSGL